MKLTEDMRKCVVFLGWQGPGPDDTAPIDPMGTGFLVLSKEGQLPTFLVTARHVAKKLHPPFVIRANKKGGGAGLIHIEKPENLEWCFHPDETVDIAVAPMIFPHWIDARGLRFDGLVDDNSKMSDLDAGDPVCVIGLFHFVHGTKRNLPITHVGHIAMLPKDELVPVDGQMREGYLIEANAISGCSGSPVLTAPTKSLNVGGVSTIIGLDTKCRLLGVWSASWKVKGSDIVAVRGDDDDTAGRLAPLGMGFVTPLVKLMDILMGDELATATERLMKRIIDQKSPAAMPSSITRSASNKEGSGE